MEQYIPKSVLVAEITHKIKVLEAFIKNFDGISDKVEKAKNKIRALGDVLLFLDTLEVKEIKLPNPHFPHLNNIVDKVFGTGNLESLEYEEAEQLVLLAKEELLKDLEIKEVDLDREIRRYRMRNPIIQHREESLYDYMANVAKHFFELGLRSTITEEDCKLIWNIGDEIPYMPEEKFFRVLLKRYKAKKGE